MSLARHKQDWEELAKNDPYWAILTDSERKFGKWDVGEFFKTGEQEIAQFLDRVTFSGFLSARGSALDFGCGVGRLTRPLAKSFSEVWGVDISDNMIAKAVELNSSVLNCHFVANAETNLNIFSDNTFDLVYTSLVLMHIPTKSLIKGYIVEFVRIIKPGGLVVFQLPNGIQTVYRLQPRRRLYSLLRTCGVDAQFIHRRLRLTPIRYTVIPEKEVLSFLRTTEARVLEVEAMNSPGESGSLVTNRVYYVTK